MTRLAQRATERAIEETDSEDVSPTRNESARRQEHIRWRERVRRQAGQSSMAALFKQLEGVGCAPLPPRERAGERERLAQRALQQSGGGAAGGDVSPSGEAGEESARRRAGERVRLARRVIGGSDSEEEESARRHEQSRWGKHARRQAGRSSMVALYRGLYGVGCAPLPPRKRSDAPTSRDDERDDGGSAVQPYERAATRSQRAGLAVPDREKPVSQESGSWATERPWRPRHRVLEARRVAEVPNGKRAKEASRHHEPKQLRLVSPATSRRHGVEGTPHSRSDWGCGGKIARTAARNLPSGGSIVASGCQRTRWHCRCASQPMPLHLHHSRLPVPAQHP